MKPWRTDPDSPSDFVRRDAAAARPNDTPSSFATTTRCVAAVGATTLALGFAEGCLHVAHRPIPLSFATKFALWNAIPSAVWSTIGPQHVAAVSNLPLSRLAVPLAGQTNANLDPTRANRFMAIKTLRSLRYAVASYGIVWAAWRWHETRSHCEPPVTLEESARVRAAPAGRVERVVRLAPTGSSLSKATATKHGDHVRHVPWHAVHRGDTIDWSTVGLEEAQRVTNLSCSNGSSGADASDVLSLLKVLELEIDGNHDGAHAFLMAKRAAAGVNGSIHTVAVIDAAASPEWHSRTNGVDIYYFALSGIIQFLCDHFDLDDAGHEIVLIGAEQEDESMVAHRKTVLHAVRHALIHRHGIHTSIGMKHALADDDVEEEDGEDVRPSVPPAVTAVFAPTADAAAKQIGRISGLVSVDRILVVVDESLRDTMGSLPRSLTKCLGVFSVADLTDAVLQRVREQLRAGESVETIQSSIFEGFGEQSALLCRADSASDIAKYI